MPRVHQPHRSRLCAYVFVRVCLCACMWFDRVAAGQRRVALGVDQPEEVALPRGRHVDGEPMLVRVCEVVHTYTYMCANKST